VLPGIDAEATQTIDPKNRGSTMLVLSRKSQESVVVGGARGFERLLKVTVLEIKSGRVRLGFEADDDVPVHRSEVWEQIRSGLRPERPPGGPISPSAG
jgi:carbon storage regulator CsrA